MSPTHALVCVLVTVRAEWVEISQQHYRKPINTKYGNSAPMLQPHFEDSTQRSPLRNYNSDVSFTSEQNYTNKTITEHNFNKGTIQRMPNMGYIKPVTKESTSVKSPFFKAEQVPNVEIVGNKKIYDSNDILKQKTPEFVTKNKNEDLNTRDVIKIYDQEEENTQSFDEAKITPVKNIKLEKNIRGNGYREDSKENENIKDVPTDTKTKTIENLMKFINVVAATISSNTRRSVKSKVRYLEDLKENLLENIGDRIDAMWPEDHAASPSRPTRSRSHEAREARGHVTSQARGHVEFPSSESALMTISFLTFAVFLIKLVLQVIQTYKTKTMMVAPAVFAAVGRTND